MFNVDVLTNTFIPCDAFSISDATTIIEDREKMTPYTITAPKLVDAYPNYFVKITDEDGTLVVDSIVKQVQIKDNYTVLTCCTIYSLLDYNSPDMVSSAQLGVPAPTGNYLSDTTTAESMVRYGAAWHMNLLKIPNSATWSVSAFTNLGADYKGKVTANLFDIWRKFRSFYTSIKIEDAGVHVHVVHERQSSPRYDIKTFSLNIDDPNIISYTISRPADHYNLCEVINDNSSGSSGNKITSHLYYLTDSGNVVKDDASQTSGAINLVTADHKYISGSGTTVSENERLAIAKSILLRDVDMTAGVSVTVKSNDLTFRSIDFDTVSNGVLYYDGGKSIGLRFSGWERTGDVTTYKFGATPLPLTVKLRDAIRKEAIEVRA